MLVHYIVNLTFVMDSLDRADYSPSKQGLRRNQDYVTGLVRFLTHLASN